MPPDQLTQIDQLLQTIAEQSQTTQVILMILALVAFGIVLIRSFGGRDKSMNSVVTQLSLLISQQNTAADKREQEHQMLVRQITEQNMKSDERWLVALENNTAAVKAITTQNAATQTLLQQHDARAEVGIKDIVARIEGVGEQIKKIDEKIDALTRTVELKFPTKSEWDERVNDIRQELQEAVQKLKDCAKRATDEHPVLPLPVEAKPEDARALTPGAESEAAA